MKKNYKWRNRAFIKKFTGSIFTVLILFGLSSSINAQEDCTIGDIQDAIICDDIDSYTNGEYLAEQSEGLWTTWNGDPGSNQDAKVTSEIAYSGDNSVLFEKMTTGLVLPLGNLTTGSYEIGMMLYLPAGNGGYYNLMHQFSIGGSGEFAIYIYFNGDGTGSTTAGGQADVAFDYTEGTWIDVHCIIDLDSDLAQMWVEGMLVREWQWSLIFNTGAPGIKRLAAANFFPAAVDDPKYYMDDVYLVETDHLVGIQELATVKDFNLYPNPNNGTFTITSAELSGSYVIDMIDLAGRIVYSEQIEISKNELKVIHTNNVNTGVYVLRMVNSSTNDIYTTRVTIR